MLSGFIVSRDGVEWAGKGKFMPLLLDSLRDSVAAPTAVQCKSEDAAFMAAQEEVVRDAIRAGTIQHFEFTYELAWKFIRRQLEAELGRAAVDGIARRELFRLAAAQRLIEDVEVWFRFHQAHNETSQTYNRAVAARVYGASLGFARDAARLLAVLEARNA